MQLIQVRDPSDSRAFIQANVDILGGVAGYIRPLDKDIEEVFDPKKNKARSEERRVGKEC